MKRAQLLAAYGQTVPALPDVIARDLRVLFCGINPSLYSAVVGHHFARPGNRFWKALHLAGFTPRVLAPSEDRALLQGGYGLTNLVARATASAAELDDEELRHGREHLAAKVRRYRPRTVAVLGISAYRSAFGRPTAGFGRQAERLDHATLWVLPNPSGLNAHFQLADLAGAYAQLHQMLTTNP